MPGRSPGGGCAEGYRGGVGGGAGRAWGSVSSWWGWDPGVAAQGGVEGVQDRLALFAGGGEVAAEGQPVLGDGELGQPAGDFGLGFPGS